MATESDLIDLLLELQLLDRVPRAGYLLRGIGDCESVSEHSFHLLFLVWALAPSVPGLDLLRAMELALLHDVAEVRIGDLPRPAARYFPAGAKQEAERRASAELLAPLDPSALERVREYEEGSSREARFVRLCDKLQILLKATSYEDRGAGGLDDFWQAELEAGEFVAVRRLYEVLVERRS